MGQTQVGMPTGGRIDHLDLQNIFLISLKNSFFLFMKNIKIMKLFYRLKNIEKTSWHHSTIRICATRTKIL